MGVTKKFSWEVDKTSLILRVTDGDRKTEWIVRKGTSTDKLRGFLGEMMLELSDVDLSDKWIVTDTPQRLVTNPEVFSVDADSEEASRAAQAERVQQLNASAKWFEADEDETYGIPIPDFDSGEI